MNTLFIFVQMSDQEVDKLLDEAINSIIKTPEELAAEHHEGEPLARTRNRFTKEEAAQKRNIRQIYPEYYKLYARRSRLLRNLKNPDISPSKAEEYKMKLSQVDQDIKACTNKPKRSKFLPKSKSAC